jgi:hypothetical protein
MSPQSVESRPAGRHDPRVGSQGLEETAKLTLAHLSAYPPRGSWPGLTVRATTSLCDRAETKMGLNHWPEDAAPPNGAPESGGRSLQPGLRLRLALGYFIAPRGAGLGFGYQVSRIENRPASFLYQRTGRQKIRFGCGFPRCALCVSVVGT